MLTDPYLLFASCFATWLRLKVIMGIIMVLCIILMSLSAWLTIPEEGTFTDVAFPSKRSYSNWDSVCNSYPYNYLSPFSFSFTSSNSTYGSSNTNTSCPWPTPNSEFRLSITIMSLFALGVLFVKTPISLIARLILLAFALMFFSAFIIDAAATTVGLDFCTNSFPNTYLNADLTVASMTVTCKSSVYEFIASFDLIISLLFFLLHTAWGMTKDLYVEKGDSSDRKALLGKTDHP
jgi:hypothetical protein